MISKLNAYQQQAAEDAKVLPAQEQTLISGALGVAAESGLLVASLRDDIIHGERANPRVVMDHIGNILWHLSLLSTSLSLSLEEAAIHNAVMRKRRQEATPVPVLPDEEQHDEAAEAVA